MNEEILEKLIVGDSDYDANLLMEKTNFVNFEYDQNTRIWLEEILCEGSQELRSRYLRFVWGKTRLSLNIDNVEHVVSKEDLENDSLPKSATCSFMLKVPTYTSKQIMKEKLEYALYNCLEIDADYHVNEQDM